MERYVLDIDGLGMMELRSDHGVLTGSRWAMELSDSERRSPNTDCSDPETIISRAICEIHEYIRGERREFTLPIIPRGTPFQTRVWEEIRNIPYGQTITYKELARRIGSPGASRAAANACGANPVPIFIPCHRVVASGGKNGGYTGGLEIKLALLELEQKFFRKQNSNQDNCNGPFSGHCFT